MLARPVKELEYRALLEVLAYKFQLVCSCLIVTKMLGVEHNTVLRIVGKGEQSTRTSKPGDLLVSVRVC